MAGIALISIKLSSRTTKGCSDKATSASSCESWAAAGYCDRNEYTRKNCKRSCGLCSVIDVDGGYGLWTRWSACSRSCGGGTKKRTRHCNNPSPEGNGKDCSRLGGANDAETCNQHQCPVKSNGCIDTESSQNCNIWKFNGLCSSHPSVKSKCERTCGICSVVDGGYGIWTSWTACSKSCGDGTRTRRRRCNNSSPEGSGKDCSRLGRATDSEACNQQPCPVKASSCIDIERSTACHYWKSNGRCESDSYVKSNCRRTCAICQDVDGHYGLWTRWSVCSKSCGGGTRKRTRHCNNPSPKGNGRDCLRLGRANDAEACNLQQCPDKANGCIDMDRSTACHFWKSKRFCESSSYVRVNCRRTCEICLDKANGCIDMDRSTACHVWKSNRLCESNSYVKINCRRTCEICFDVDGGYGLWTRWSVCSKSCGGGTRKRTRHCNNPSPGGNGKDCSRLGRANDAKACNLQQCPGLASHIGCYDYNFRPQSWHSVNLFSRNAASITQQCINICRGRRSYHAALRYQKCYCFDNLRRYEKKPNGFCDTKCRDGTTLKCGGYWGISVYELDLDECTTGRHNCEHRCKNTFGSFTCSCQSGYYLGSDRKSCYEAGQKMDRAVKQIRKSSKLNLKEEGSPQKNVIDCKDLTNACLLYGKLGHCKSWPNRKYMAKNCKKTCQLCKD